jgi:RNA polymerase sigma factor (sigma-70 family)
MLDIGALYAEHWGPIYGFLQARLLGADPAEIEDLTAIVFERVVAHAARYEERGRPPSSWLYQIAANLLIDVYRQRRGRLITSSAAVEAHAPPVADAGTDRQLDALMVAEALTMLTPKQRLVLVERYLIGASVQDTALVLGMSQISVKHVAGRAIKQLRAILSEVA